MMDMVPPEGGRSIRNIPLPESKKKSVKTAEIETVREVHQEFTRIRSEKPRNWKMYMYVGGGVAIVLLGIIVSNIFHSAKVSVTPRTLVADINTNLSAKKNYLLNMFEGIIPCPGFPTPDFFFSKSMAILKAPLRL